MGEAAAPLTDAEVRQLLRTALTVVKPGELLVLRIGAEWNMTPNQLREYNDALRHWAGDMVPGVEIMAIWASDGQVFRREDYAALEAEHGSVTHASPPLGSDGLLPCCGRSPFDVPRWHRMTSDASAVTCEGPK